MVRGPEVAAWHSAGRQPAGRRSSSKPGTMLGDSICGWGHYTKVTFSSPLFPHPRQLSVTMALCAPAQRIAGARVGKASAFRSVARPARQSVAMHAFKVTLKTPSGDKTIDVPEVGS